MKLRVFTLVYGEKHIRWFKDGLVKSLCSARNRKALEGATWDLFVPECDRDTVASIAAYVGISIRFHDVEPDDLIDSMRVHAELCIKKGATMLTAHPDNIFSDGSIGNMLALAGDPGSCVALAHPRVLPDMFMSPPLWAPMLVDEAMGKLHPSFAASDLSLDSLNTWHGGVGWRKLGEGLWAVSVSCPSVFVANMLPSDLPYLSDPGAWDHEWPTALLESDRLRFIGSSDAAFVVELTDKAKHGPVLAPKPAGASRTATYPTPYHRAVRSLQAIWRGCID